MKVEKAAYKPPVVNTVNREAQKDALIETFQRQNGTLPKGSMMPSVQAEALNVANQNVAPKAPRQKRLEDLDAEEMFDVVVKEIEERQAHLQRMNELGELTEETEGRLRNQIASRINDLERLKKLQN